MKPWKKEGISRIEWIKKNSRCPIHPGRSAVPGKVHCQECLDKAKINNKIRYKNAIENGYCPNHPSRLAVPEKTLCHECFDKLKFRYKNAIENNRCQSHPGRLSNVNGYCNECHIAQNLRSRVRRAIHNEIYKPGSTSKIGSAVRDLGCTIPEFIKYIESKFQPGMSWDNYGKEWHLDHIIPLSNFDLTNSEQFRKATHYTNYQPLWKVDNFKKSNKIFKF